VSEKVQLLWNAIIQKEGFGGNEKENSISFSKMFINQLHNFES
jgi:hypothetical protein